MTTQNAPGSSESKGPALKSDMTLPEKADAVEEHMMQELNVRISKSMLFTLGEQDPSRATPPAPGSQPPGPKRALMGDDPRLRKMPKQPKLRDFYELRFGSANHVLQSATHALKAGCDEKIIIACLLHDIAVNGFIRADHGYWGAQLVGPYVDEEVSWGNPRPSGATLLR